MNGTWNLKLFLSISLGLHLFVLFLLSVLVPDLKITRLPRLNIEVSLLSLAREERELPKRIENKFKVWSSPAIAEASAGRELEARSEEKEPFKIAEKKVEMKIAQVEKVEVAIPTKEQEPITTQSVQSEARVVSISEPKSSPPESEKKVIENRQEERVVVASLGNPVPSVISSEKPQTVIPPKADPPLAERSPSLSEGEILFARPRYADNPKPLYPQEARNKGYEGEVLLRVQVLSNGRVGEIEVRRSSGHEILDRSAIKTVKQWRFIPAKKGETPVPVWVNIPVAFQLR